MTAAEERHPCHNRQRTTRHHHPHHRQRRHPVVLSLAVLFLLSCSMTIVSAQEEEAQSQPPTDKQQLSNTTAISPGGLGPIGIGGPTADNSNNNGNDNSDNTTLVTSPPTNNDTATTTTTAPAPVPAATTTPATTTPAEDSTAAPTLPLSSLDLPPSVDIAECRKHLQVVDTDRNNLMTEEEYVKFVHQVVTHDFNHSLANLPSDQNNIWGTSLRQMPKGVRTLYYNLDQGGVIEIVGYKANQIPKPTLAQELFLIKVCVHTEIVIHQILEAQQEAAATTDTSQQVISIPDVEVVTVYSSFQLSNRVGVTTATLDPETSHNRKGLDLAYQTLVTQVVGTQVGMTLTKPSPTVGATAKSSSSSNTGREATRSRRRLTIALDQQLPEIYRIDDVPCPAEAATANNGSASLQTEWCQNAYGKFLLYLVGEDSIAVYNDFSQAVQNATANGKLQQTLNDVAPTAEVQVTGAGAGILPPPPAPAPTLPPHLAPTSAPQNTTVEESEPEGSGANLGMIFALAGILLSVNCCIIGVSVFMCWRNRNNDDIDEDDDGLEDMDGGYYNRDKNKKTTKSGKPVIINDPSSSYYDDEQAEMNPIPPTLDDIAEANAPAPAPSPIHDAQERERILQGQGASNQSGMSSGSASAPTLEEITATLASASAPGSRPLAPPSDASYDDKKMKVDAGEMA